MKAHSWAGSSSFASPSKGPAVTWRTVTPGSSSTTGGRSEEVARVTRSTSTPSAASRRDSSTTYTFIPPASPVPGWSSGEVCTVTMAMRRGTRPRARINVVVTNGTSERAEPQDIVPDSLLANRRRKDASMSRGCAVVTGASSGIGAATARRLVAEGFEVVAAARRRDRLDALCAETGARALTLDVTSAESVAALADEVSEATVLVNNAGLALGMDPVAEADPEDWRRMYEVNVIGALRVTQALLPALVASGRGHVVVMGSTAGRIVYEGGGGYTAAKHGAAALAETLRLELNGRPVRVTEIAPGMVATEEFALTRFGGDAARAAKVYEGVDAPLTAEDVADCVAWCVTRPPHVDVDLLVVKPLAQAAQHKVHRRP